MCRTDPTVRIITSPAVCHLCSANVSSGMSLIRASVYVPLRWLAARMLCRACVRLFSSTPFIRASVYVPMLWLAASMVRLFSGMSLIPASVYVPLICLAASMVCRACVRLSSFRLISPIWSENWCSLLSAPSLALSANK